MPFEVGNKLAARPRLFDQALRKAIAQDDGKRVRECVEQMLTFAAAGEMWAVRELADRLDGKPAQSITHAGDIEKPVIVAMEDFAKIKAAWVAKYAKPSDGA